MDKDFLSGLLYEIVQAIAEHDESPEAYSKIATLIGHSLITTSVVLSCNKREDKIEAVRVICESMEILVTSVHDKAESAKYIDKIMSKINEE